MSEYTDINYLNDSVEFFSAYNGGTGPNIALCRTWPVPYVNETIEIGLGYGTFTESGSIYFGYELGTYAGDPNRPINLFECKASNVTTRYYIQTLTETRVDGFDDHGESIDTYDFTNTLSSLSTATNTPYVYTRADSSQFMVYNSITDPSSTTSSSITFSFGGEDDWYRTTTVTTTATVLFDGSSYGLTPFLYYESRERHISSYIGAFSFAIAGYNQAEIYYTGVLQAPPDVLAQQADNIQLYPSFTGNDWYKTMTVTDTNPISSSTDVYNYDDFSGSFFNYANTGQEAMKTYIYNGAIEYVYLGNFIGAGGSYHFSKPSPEAQGYNLITQTDTLRVWAKSIGTSSYSMSIALSNPYDWHGQLEMTHSLNTIITGSLATFVSTYKADESDMPVYKQTPLPNGGDTTSPQTWDYAGDTTGRMLVISADGTWDLEDLPISSGTDYYTGSGGPDVDNAPYINGGSVTPSSPGNIIAAVGNFSTMFIDGGIGLAISA